MEQLPDDIQHIILDYKKEFELLEVRQEDARRHLCNIQASAHYVKNAYGCMQGAQFSRMVDKIVEEAKFVVEIIMTEILTDHLLNRLQWLEDEINQYLVDNFLLSMDPFDGVYDDPSENYHTEDNVPPRLV